MGIDRSVFKLFVGGTTTGSLAAFILSAVQKSTDIDRGRTTTELLMLAPESAPF
jgi:hypothetical protein